MSRVIATAAQSRATKHEAGDLFQCCRCKEFKPVCTNGGTGYEITTTHSVERGHAPGIDLLMCYECCGETDRADMLADGKATLYLTRNSADGSAKISNWPGTLKFTGRYRRGSHNIARWRYDVWFRGPDNTDWHGVTYGDNTQICHCRRLKHKLT